MKRSARCALIATALAMAAPSALPTVSHAAPLALPQIQAPEASPDVVYVQRRREDRRPRDRDRRRRSGDAIVPLIGGLAAGAIILGIEADRARERERRREREVYYDEDDHIAWCLERYRSYDIRSDSYQPYEGPRRRCISPYS